MNDSCEDDLSEVKDETEGGDSRSGEVEDTDRTLELESCLTENEGHAHQLHGASSSYSH